MISAEKGAETTLFLPTIADATPFNGGYVVSKVLERPDPAVFPAAGTNAYGQVRRGVMASDISLAVADGDSVTTTDSTTPDSVSHLTDSTTAGPVTTTDPLTAIGIQTLSQADVEHERDRADQAERQVEIEWQLVEEGRKRIDELQASLADERWRIDGLHTELADARTMAMISGSEAAVLRTQLTLLTDKRRRP